MLHRLQSLLEITLILSPFICLIVSFSSLDSQVELDHESIEMDYLMLEAQLDGIDSQDYSK